MIADSIRSAKRTIALLLTAFLLLVPIYGGSLCEEAAAVESITFTDIKGHWAGKEIGEMAGQGFIKGYPDGTFLPDVPVTEEQFFSMVHRVLPPITEHAFDPFVTDIYLSNVKNRWSEASYKRLMVAGISSFGKPAGSITRINAAHVMLQALASQSLGDKYRHPEKEQIFRDIPLYAGNSNVYNESEIIFVYPIYKLGMMSGFPDGTFRPNEQLTRAQAVVLLNKLRETQQELYPDNVNSATKQHITKALRTFIDDVMTNHLSASFDDLAQYVKEKKLPVTAAFLAEHFDFLRYEATDYVAFPRFDELVYISKISSDKYRVTVQYYSGELGGSVDRTFYVSSTDGTTFKLIGKNE